MEQKIIVLTELFGLVREAFDDELFRFDEDPFIHRKLKKNIKQEAQINHCPLSDKRVIGHVRFESTANRSKETMEGFIHLRIDRLPFFIMLLISVSVFGYDGHVTIPVHRDQLRLGMIAFYSLVMQNV